MSQMIVWMIGIAMAGAAMVVSAAMQLYSVHFALAAIISSFIAVTAMRDHAAAASDGVGRAGLAAVISRYMGFLWAWSAVAVFLTYALVMAWTNWLGAFMVLVVGAGLCLFVARVLDAEAHAETPDAHLVGFVGLMARVQLTLTCIVVGGLLAAGRFGPEAFGGYNKWAAVNVLLCAAIGLAVLSGFAIATEPQEEPAV
jgi:hypothetical protein